MKQFIQNLILRIAYYFHQKTTKNQPCKPSYQETVLGGDFDWFTALSQPHINSAAWERLSILSSKWTTCACGNQCVIIPRDYCGNPLDSKLALLGVKFAQCVEARDAESALATLYAIEQRSAYLIWIERRKQNGQK